MILNCSQVERHVKAQISIQENVLMFCVFSQSISNMTVRCPLCPVILEEQEKAEAVNPPQNSQLNKAHSCHITVNRKKSVKKILLSHFVSQYPLYRVSKGDVSR